MYVVHGSAMSISNALPTMGSPDGPGQNGRLLALTPTLFVAHLMERYRTEPSKGVYGHNCRRENACSIDIDLSKEGGKVAHERERVYK